VGSVLASVVRGAPYVAGKWWEYPQIAPQEFGVAFFLMCQAAVKWRDEEYLRAALHAPGVNAATARAWLVLNDPSQPNVIG